jgi:hypothetical protein
MSGADGTGDAGAPDEAERLLPWRATGRLSPADRATLDALPGPELARRLAFAEEERAATAALIADLPEPSAAARAALFARIGALDAQKPEQRVTPTRAAGREGPLDRLAAWLAGLSPRALGLAAAAAALVVAVQAGALVAALVGGGTRYEVASAPGPGTSAGTFALVAFAPEATAARIDALLAARGATIVDGPRPGGLYRVRIAASLLAPAERDAALDALRASGIVRLAVPGGT